MTKKIQALIDVIFRVATGSRKVSIFLTPVVALVFWGILVFGLFAAFRLDGLLQLPPVVPIPFNMIAASLFSVIGLAIVIWCSFVFLQAKGTPVPVNPPKQLVETGLYSITRNPMLTGLFMLIFGIGLYLNSISIIFLFFPAFVFISYLEVKYVEEPELEKRLGASYMDYKSRVPRFLPTRILFYRQ